jgi:hypothetical protein
MIHETIQQIEARLRNASSLKEENKAELTQLLNTLKAEVSELSKTHGEQARSIAGFTDVSTHEATRAQKNPKLLEVSLDGLKSSVTEFEKSHPKLVEVVNCICVTLSNLGI